jgi:pimeloyl-ACP methyl ester carboxylesterase
VPIEPFTVPYDPGAVEDLHRRLDHTHWPGDGLYENAEYGLRPAFLREICRFWRHSFSWEEEVLKLREQPHFLFESAGNRIHFLHWRGVGPNPKPLIVTHGWPGSFLEMEKIAPRLADPAAFGGDPKNAFHVVVPSLPGFGFSRLPAGGAIDNFRVAALWVSLMEELGYPRFAAQGGDIGAGVGTALGLTHPDRLIGLHLNYIPGSYRPPGFTQTEMTPEDESYLHTLDRWNQENGAYSHMHRSRPYSAMYGLLDSPVGLAAWILEKFRDWSDCGGDVYRRFSRGELLRNLTLYWMTGTIGSSFLIYAGNAKRPLAFAPGQFISAPCAIAHFPKELSIPPRPWVNRGYNVQRWTAFSSGGHFAALEEPELLAEDIRSFFQGS